MRVVEAMNTETGVEEQWRAAQEAWMNLKPGDAFTVKHGDVEYIDTVKAITYQSGEYVPRPEMSRWQQVLRRLTPRRWRKPLPMGHSLPGTYTITTRRDPDPVGRAQYNIAAIQKMAADLAHPGGVGVSEKEQEQ